MSAPSETETTVRLSRIRDVLSTNQWAGKPAFVIGGGPSLRGFDFSSLEDVDAYIIAANMGFVHPPRCDAFCFMDARVPNLAREMDVWKQTKALKIAHQCCEKELVKWKPPPDDVYIMELDREWNCKWGGTIECGTAPITNTGAMALQLADILGADPIFLLGFDMYGDGKKTANYHDLYPGAWAGSANSYDRYDDGFLECLRSTKRRIVNLNPKSNIYYFAKCQPHEAIQIAKGERAFGDVFTSERKIGTTAGPFAIPAKKGDDPVGRIVKAKPPDVRLGELAQGNNNIGSLLMELRALGKQVDSVAEFGTGRYARSLTAWIAARVGEIDTYDIKPMAEPAKREIADMAQQAHVKVRCHQVDTSELVLQEDVDLLMIDSLHTGTQLRAELDNNHERVKRFIVIHDVVTHGWNGQKPGIPIPPELMRNHIADVVGDGLLPAVFYFLANHWEWSVKKLLTHNNGLLVLERRE